MEIRSVSIIWRLYFRNLFCWTFFLVISCFGIGGWGEGRGFVWFSCLLTVSKEKTSGWNSLTTQFCDLVHIKVSQCHILSYLLQWWRIWWRWIFIFQAHELKIKLCTIKIALPSWSRPSQRLSEQAQLPGSSWLSRVHWNVLKHKQSQPSRG